VESSVEYELLEEILILILGNSFFIFCFAQTGEAQTNLEVCLKNELDYSLCLHSFAQLFERIIKSEKFTCFKLQSQIPWRFPEAKKKGTTILEDSTTVFYNRFMDFCIDVVQVREKIISLLFQNQLEMSKLEKHEDSMNFTAFKTFEAALCTLLDLL
jgi:hypothetical protein